MNSNDSIHLGKKKPIQPEEKEQPQKIKSSKSTTGKATKKKRELSTPHDVFFKANMSKPEVLANFLEVYLPKEIQSQIDYTSLVPIEPKSITPSLKLRESDLLFRFSILDWDAYLLVLMEHKSYTDRRTPIQILRYITEIWDKNLSVAKPICPVLPIVLYQGAKKWEYPQLGNHLPKDTPPELLPYLPLYQALYYDFSMESDLIAKGRLKPGLEHYLKIIQTIYTPEKNVFIQEVREIFKGLTHLDQEVLIEYLERSIAYISAFRQDISDENIIEMMTQEGEDTMETIIDRLERRGERRGEERGRLAGIEEGRLEGHRAGVREGRSVGKQEEKQLLAKKMKAKGYSTVEISEITELAWEVIERL